MNVIERERREEREERKEGKGRSKGSAQLTPRDFAALSWLLEQKAATLPQLTLLLGFLGEREISDRRGAQIVARWVSLGLVERTAIWHRKPAVVWPTSSGALLVGARRWKTPALGTLRHTLAVSEVRLRVCRPWNGRTWLTEARLREVLAKEIRLPDGAFVEKTGEMTAVEVELSSHGRTRVRDAMTSLTAARDGDHDQFHHVLYLCAPETLFQCTQVRQELPDSIRSRVVVLPCPE
jgi:hypothetical protein